jgi:hypothetical protein
VAFDARLDLTEDPGGRLPRLAAGAPSRSEDGQATETVSARNRTRRGAYVFLDVYLPENGASAPEYRALIATTR